MIAQKESRQVITTVPVLNARDSFKKFTLSVNVRRITTDSTGTVLDDATVPAAQQKAYPFHLFGDFDKNGGFAISDMIMSGQSNSILFSVYTIGLNTPLFFFSPLATINSQLKKGDLVFIYVDDINAPSYFHFVICSAMSGGYGSLVALTNTTQIDDKGNWGTFKFYDVKFSWFDADDVQLGFSLWNIKTAFNGAYSYDQIQPEAYRYTQSKPEVKIITIPLEKLINQYYGLSSLIAWENPLLNLSFNIYA